LILCEQNDMLRLNQVFKRIMHQPLSNLDEFWEKYNQFVLAQQLSVLATNDELRELVGEDDMMDEGLLRVKIVNAVEAIKKKTAEGVYRRQTFEAGIDRSYFHVTPVTDASLRNWHNYLDYEEVAGDNARCEVLYERCLIACANYEDMWVRYAAWKEKVAGFDAANEVFQRAVTIFLKYRASIYLEYASFLEAHDKVGEAENMYNKVLSDVAPTLIEAHLRFCNFERRRKNLEATAAAYDRAMESVKDTETDVVAHVATTYATFLHRSCGDVSRTRAVYEHAIEKAGSSLLLWLNYIAFETDASSGSSETFPSAVAALFERAIADSSTLGNDEKNDMWLKYADFMEMYDASIKSVRELYERELMWKRKNGVSRERSMKVLSWSAGSSNATDDYEVGSKRQRVEPSGADAATSAGTIPVAAAASTSATNAYASQYYQGYQVTFVCFSLARAWACVVRGK
jgi:tetratricopeptide (TPR) repeat protein